MDRVRSQLVSLEFLIDIKFFRSHYDPGLDSAFNRNEYHEHFLWGGGGGKGGRCVRLTTLLPSCAFVMISGNLNFLELSGPLQTCNGSALPLPLPFTNLWIRSCRVERKEDTNVRIILRTSWSLYARGLLQVSQTVIILLCKEIVYWFTAVAKLVEALRYKPEGRGFDSRLCHWNFSLT